MFLVDEHNILNLNYQDLSKERTNNLLHNERRPSGARRPRSTSILLTQRGIGLSSFVNGCRIATMKRTTLIALCCALQTLPVYAGSKAARSILYTATNVVDSAASSSHYPAFTNIAKASIVIPGLKEGFVPQGLAFLPERRWFLFSGYHPKHPSPLIAVDAESGRIEKQVRLRNLDGSDFKGHAGGVAVVGENIVVSHRKAIHCLPLSDFLSCTNGVCTFSRKFTVTNNASYCFCDEGVFWVGEFYEPSDSDYDTLPTHKWESDGECFQAWLCGYKLKDGELPLTDDGKLQPPDYILETDKNIQGASISGGEVWLSASFNRRRSSSLMRFSSPLESEPGRYYSVDGREVPAWFLGERQRVAKITAPPMTENLCRIGNDVFIVFESAADKYRSSVLPSKHPIDRLFFFSNSPSQKSKDD